MRYILSIALILVACTKPNADFVGGNGGTGGTGGTGGGGAAGSGGVGGGGGGGGGGGSGGVIDMAMSQPADMRTLPPDMATLDGVACGAMSCKQSECCVNSSGPHCVTGGCTNGPLFMCDGPEDCASGNFAPDCCLQTSSSGPGGTKISGSGCMLTSDPACVAILCHSTADCPTGQGYVGCCALQTSQYKRCSKTPCP